MIIDEANNYYYFAIRNLSELNSLGWFKDKKDAIINNNDNNNNNNNNNFQNALVDALNYQVIHNSPQRIPKLKPYIKKYNWEGINFPAGSKKWRRFEKSNHREDFYCLNCFNSYTTENKVKEHEEICNKNDSCCMEMRNQVMLKHNPGEKSLKAPFTIYLDL